MATILKNYEPKKPQRPSRYPWDEWFDGRIRRLTQGKKNDFQCSVASMADLCRKTARKREFPVTVHEESKAVVIEPLEAPKAPVKPPKKKTGPKSKSGRGRNTRRG